MSIGVKHYGVNDPKPRPGGVPNNRKSKPFGMKGHPFDALKGMLLPLKTPPPRWEPGNEPIPGRRSSVDEKVKATVSDQPGFLDAKVAGSVVVRSNRVQLDNDVAAPGVSKVYGTNKDGDKGWFEAAIGTPEDPGEAVDIMANSFSQTTDADINDETEEGDTWQAGGEKGLVIYLPCKIPFNDGGNEVLYVCWRPFTLTPDGRIYLIGAQTRNVIDTPVEEA